MGVASDGLKTGKDAGKKAGQKAGQNIDPEGNIIEEGAGASAKGAMEGMAKGAAKGAVKGGAKGIKEGATKGGELGSAIPYVGKPIGIVVGGAVGGLGGTLVGGTTGGVSGAASGATTGLGEAIKKQKEENDKQAKERLKLKNMLMPDKMAENEGLKKYMKFTYIFHMVMNAWPIFVIILVFIVAALFAEGIAEDTAEFSRSQITEYYANSTSQAGQLYNETGSLSLSTQEDIGQITNNYLEEIEKTNPSYHDALSTVYSGKPSATVASRVTNITTNFEAGETTNVPLITDESPKIAGAASPADSKTIYEHILNTEKYNFNNIIWRSYERQGNNIIQKPVQYALEAATGLVYPARDVNATNGRDLDLKFFLTKVRPYLQTWQIPFDLITGTQDAQVGNNLNTDFAYEIITSAYHEIVVDRYKTESLVRNTNYLVYDQNIVTTTTLRECGTYAVETTKFRSKGERCTKADYDKGLCEDAIMEYSVPCNDEIEACMVDLEGNPLPKTVSCNDTWQNGCSYGTLKEDVTETITEEKVFCTDSTSSIDDITTDIRESKASPVNNSAYSWNYVVSSAKMLDKVISYTYRFEPYYIYPVAYYNDYINKRGQYAAMSPDEFRKSELINSNALDFSTEEKEYRYEDRAVDNSNSGWNERKVVDSIPENAKLIEGSTERKIVNKVVETYRNGMEYLDTYSWADTLKFVSTKSGIYNVDSVKDVTGDDLTGDDYDYYNFIYAGQELNLIDLMNSDNNIYENYIDVGDRSTTTTNIGIRRNALDISYNVLKKELQTLSDTYPITGLMYGSSLGLIQGLNLGSIVASGTVNDAIVAVADACLGYNLDRMLTLETYGTFFRNHWCAMFVSYCMRTVEMQAKVSIPIPNFSGCSTFWKSYHNRNGFYDVQEWVQTNSGANLVTNDPEHIAPLSAIQPGDIILYSWDAKGIRNHTAIVKTVEKDEAGNVTSITTIDGNWNGSSFNDSTVQYVKHSINGRGPYDSLSSIASFVSISTVLAGATNGNIW